MKTCFRAAALPAVALVFVLGSGCVSRHTTRSWTFDEASTPAINTGWIAGATNPSATAGTWTIANGQLALANVEAVERPTFNLLWREDVAFLDGSLSVRLRSDAGVIDRGGGLMWRVRDANNYYIARYNPLETNLRVYTVKDGNREMLQDAPGITIAEDEWTTLAVDHHGQRIVVSLDGKALIEVTDNTFPQPGRVGLWTKADAATTFDDLVISPAGR